MQVLNSVCDPWRYNIVSLRSGGGGCGGVKFRNLYNKIYFQGNQMCEMNHFYYCLFVCVNDYSA